MVRGNDNKKFYSILTVGIFLLTLVVLSTVNPVDSEAQAPASKAVFYKLLFRTVQGNETSTIEKVIYSKKELDWVEKVVSGEASSQELKPLLGLQNKAILQLLKVQKCSRNSLHCSTPKKGVYYGRSPAF